MSLSLTSHSERFVVSADWVSPWSEDTWNAFRSASRPLAATDDSSDGSTAVCGPIRFDIAGRRMLAVLAGRKHDDLLMWQLRVDPQPSEPAPREIEDAERRIGGLTGFLAVVSAVRSNDTPLANFEVDVLMSERAWACRLLPRAITSTSPESHALALGSEVFVEQIGLRFVSGAGGVEETTVVYLHQSGMFHVQIRARSVLKFTEESLIPTAADEVFDVIRGQFFQRRREDSRASE